MTEKYDNLINRLNRYCKHLEIQERGCIYPDHALIYRKERKTLETIFPELKESKIVEKVEGGN